MRQIVLACVVFGGLIQNAAAQTAQQNWGDKLFGGVTAHDFGNVARGAQLKKSLKMTNIYKVPLTITSIRVSCGCVTATAPVQVLEPNQSTELQISMDGRQFSGPKQVKVFVTVGPQFVSTATLTISANARQDVVFNPGEIDFGAITRGQAATKAVEVEYAGPLDWQVSEIVKSATAPFDLKVEEMPQNANNPFVRRGYRIHATIKAEASPGPFKQEIILKTNDPATPNLNFHINGTIQTALTVSPSTLKFDTVQVGETKTKKFLIKSDRPFRIMKVDGIGEGVSVDIPEKQDQNLFLTVNFQPGRTGELHRQLVIHTNLNNETAVIQLLGDVAGAAPVTPVTPVTPTETPAP